jgi:acyl-CoA synthetase (AMP-forming)/AMP-acid ligase II
MGENWKIDLDAWLTPFLGAFRHKVRERMCPVYIAGLIGAGDRKSIQPMAAREGEVGYDQLRHFVASGAWDPAPLEKVLLAEAGRMVGGSDAWLIIDDTALPKKGRHSVGVAPHGWFRRGDVGYLDADGFLFLTDRKKDLIISGDENIASSEVERAIYELAGVSEVAVIGVPDPRWGERPVAVVVLRNGAKLDLATLRAHCRVRLAGFKIPSRLELRDALPRNPSGKVLKRVLRDELAAGC